MSEFVAALIGAVVGGGATFWATWWQTGRVLSHERDMALEATRAQQRAKRHEVDQDAARELIPWLNGLENVLPDLARGAHLYLESGKRVNAKIEELRDLQHSTVALLSPDGARNAWAQLRALISEYASAWTTYSETDSDRVLNVGWTDQKVIRSQRDVEGFIAYVRAHLMAVIDESAPPASVEHLPVLQRQDMSQWEWTDQRTG